MQWVKVLRVDWHCTGSARRWLLWALGFDACLIIFSAFSDALSGVTFGALGGLMGVIPLTPFMASQQRGLDGLFALTPIPRKHVVIGHYAYALTAIIAVVLDVYLVQQVIRGLGMHATDLADSIWPSLAIAAFFLLATSLQFPLLVRWGFERVSWAVYVPIAVLAALLFWLLDHAGVKTLLQDKRYLWVVIIGIMAVYLVSLGLSIVWYQRREL